MKNIVPHTKPWAVILLLLFAIVITPSVVFHNLFADHTDFTLIHKHLHANEVAQSSVDCHWNSLVCEGSFVGNTQWDVLFLQKTFSLFYGIYLNNVPNIPFFKLSSRGPPANSQC